MKAIDNPFLITLSARIKATMQRKGITQKQLALATQIDEASISRAINGKTNLCLSTIQKIEFALEETLIQTTPLQP